MPSPAVDRVFLCHDPRPADLVIGFGHHVAQSNAARARRAARLYLEGLVPRVLFTGGNGEAARMAEVAGELGVPREAVLVEGDSRTTFENAARSRELLAAMGLLGEVGAALLVSCPWHMGRVARVLRRVFPPEVQFACCPHTESCAADIWQHSAECRRHVLAEAELLDALICRGALAAEA